MALFITVNGRQVNHMALDLTADQFVAFKPQQLKFNSMQNSNLIFRYIEVNLKMVCIKVKVVSALLTEVNIEEILKMASSMASAGLWKEMGLPSLDIGWTD